MARISFCLCPLISSIVCGHKACVICGGGGYMCHMRRRRIHVSAHRAQSMCHMRRRRIHVSAHRAQSTLIIILEPHVSSSSHRAQSTLLIILEPHVSSSSHRAQNTLIKALSSHHVS